MKKAIVVGSGAGGCIAAREIALRGYEVTTSGHLSSTCSGLSSPARQGSFSTSA